MKKKFSLGWLTEIFDLFGELFDLVKVESEDKIVELKEKVKYYMIVYGLFIVAMLFLLIGLVKYLAETYVLPSEGIAFLAVGSVMIVLLAAYSLIKKA